MVLYLQPRSVPHHSSRTCAIHRRTHLYIITPNPIIPSHIIWRRIAEEVLLARCRGQMNSVAMRRLPNSQHYHQPKQRRDADGEALHAPVKFYRSCRRRVLDGLLSSELETRQLGQLSIHQVGIQYVGSTTRTRTPTYFITTVRELWPLPSCHVMSIIPDALTITPAFISIAILDTGLTDHSASFYNC
jgi:hypothetical protein